MWIIKLNLSVKHIPVQLLDLGCFQTRWIKQNNSEIFQFLPTQNKNNFELFNCVWKHPKMTLKVLCCVNVGEFASGEL